jgi:hypothetical protein
LFLAPLALLIGSVLSAAEPAEWVGQWKKFTAPPVRSFILVQPARPPRLEGVDAKAKAAVLPYHAGVLPLPASAAALRAERSGGGGGPMLSQLKSLKVNWSDCGDSG